MGELSIQQVVERCQQGDEQAYGQLYTLMHNRLRRVCRHYATDEASTDDLVHDAFLLILSKLATLKDTARAEGWMLTVTRNLAQAWLSKQRREATVPLDTVAPAQAVASGMAAVSYEEILRLVDALPKSYSRVFRLKVLEGMSHQEIASLLNIEPHTSSAQLHRAKLMLRRWLRPMVMVFVAVVLPLGVWRLTKYRVEPVAENVESPPIVPPLEERRAVEEATTVDRAAKDVRPVANGATKDVVPAVADDTVRVAAVVADNTATAADTTSRKTVEPPTVSREPEVWTAQTPSCREKTWAVDLAYSGLAGGRDLQLPYADANMNDAVYDSVAHHRMPLTVALMVNRRLTPHWQVGVGVQYTRLTSDMEAGNTYSKLVQQQRVQYLGVPLSVQWHWQLARRLSFYAAATATVQLPLRSTLDTHYVLSGTAVEATTERLHPGVQWSAGLGLGLQYDVTPTVGFFVEPSLQHYFRNGSSVRTWQTEHPAAVTVPFGLRINF
ncbi:MAG: sigma-70 family RNA polymerase sigma factor [Prevotella sp.]|nr:sigma-70 family RNA polymerase sigma factor [Prevotella sp.]